MKEAKKMSEKFHQALKHEGIVSITSWGVEVHVANTWNSFLVVTDDERILIPSYGYRKTSKNVDVNDNVLLTFGTREVLGHKDYPGIGFLVEGSARFFNSGAEFDMMKEKFSFLNRVLEIKVKKITQKI
ncbi:MAG: pyridoxamine 5'-phosphate oxidase family protein [Bacteroidales bacterium]